jgi:hypothetical protein
VSAGHFPRYARPIPEDAKQPAYSVGPIKHLSSKFARVTVEGAQPLDVVENDRPRGGCVLGLQREQRREMIDENQPAERAAKITGTSPARKRPRGGAVAQTGERCNRTAEVRGSNPLSSTR